MSPGAAAVAIVVVPFVAGVVVGVYVVVVAAVGALDNFGSYTLQIFLV